MARDSWENSRELENTGDEVFLDWEDGDVKRGYGVGKVPGFIEVSTSGFLAEGVRFLVECGEMTHHTATCQRTEGSRAGQALLEEYDTIFNMPSGLPPQRGHEHLIQCKEGVGPVNVRPYS
ncbi:hypothetical protein OROGR_019767 [Orobanche gracilis]